MDARRRGLSHPAPRLELQWPADPRSIAAARAAAREFAASHGASSDLLIAVTLAISEAATNAVLHAFVDRAPGHFRLLAAARHDELVLSVIDDGHGMRPRADSPGIGMGLPTIGQLTTMLDIRQAPGGGTEVRMSFDAPGVHGMLSEADDELLAEVARLAAGSGWPDHGVDAMVRLLVPRLADACMVDVVDAEGIPRRLTAHVHEDPELSAWLAARPPQPRYEESPTYGALDRAEAMIVEIDDELQAAAALDPDDLESMRRLPTRWWVVVPLREGERAHGLLHLGLAARPSDEEVAFFEQLAERAARGLANLRLIEDLRQTRGRLERILGALAEAVTVHDADNTIVYANPAALRLLGATDVSEVLGAAGAAMMARFRVTQEDGTPVGLDDLPGHRALAGEEAPRLLTRSVHLESGRERWLLTRATKLDEESPLAVNIIEDLTEIKRAERRHRFLARAGRLLVGIPAPDMPQRLAELVVEVVADWCAIDVLDAAELPARVALAGGEEPVPLADGSSGARLLTGDAVPAELRVRGARSLATAPVRASAMTLGAMTVLAAAPLEDADLALLSDVAERAAIALLASRGVR